MNDKDIPLANSKVLYETLSTDEDYTVSKTIVRAGGETQWHSHTHVRDRLVVVQGILTVETKVGELTHTTQVSDYHAVEPGVVHHVRNTTADDVVYIMIQSGGARDIVLAQTENEA
jgi:mannose-6-phosphate isomerase-like protein (cupin superfamily)